MKLRFATFIGLALCLLSTPLWAYTVYLKDGSKLLAKQAPEIRGETAIVVLQNGTRTSIEAAEIDIERTRAANKTDLGGALILEGGEFRAMPLDTEPQEEERLADLIRSGKAGQQVRTQATRSQSRARSAPVSGSDSLQAAIRAPYREFEVSAAMQEIFQGQNIGSAQLYQGTQNKRLLIDLTTDSEAAVFRALRVTAAALTHIQEIHPDTVSAVELVLLTSNRRPAGEFVLSREDAAQLATGAIEVATYFVENVRF